jgi:hypothetical protein
MYEIIYFLKPRYWEVCFKFKSVVFAKIFNFTLKKQKKINQKIASKAFVIDKSFTLPKTQLRKLWLNLFFLEKCKRVQVILFSI